ncbi:MAG: hypothetical protein M5U08_10450 [Burkholderiales bacterium]|nr:hypothetical protein [Burkholderiales bacterium]
MDSVLGGRSIQLHPLDQPGQEVLHRLAVEAFQVFREPVEDTSHVGCGDRPQRLSDALLGFGFVQLGQ